MTPWMRRDTKDWIERLESRIDDISYFLEKTTQWCDDNFVDDDRMVFMCCFLTCIWVSQIRNEPITYVELMEILGVEDIEVEEEKIYELDQRYAELEHEELLRRAVDTLSDDLF